MPEDRGEAQELHERWDGFVKRWFKVKPSSISSIASSLLLPFTKDDLFWRPTSSTVSKHVENARYGGRQEVYRWKHRGEIYSYDLIKAYLHCLRDCHVPAGGPARTQSAPKNPTLLHCKVRLPNSYLGLLPTRQGSSIVWPVDSEIEGTWYKAELDYAQSQGAQILGVYNYITFRSQRVFQELADRVLEALVIAPQYQGLIKLLGNILVGKFSQRKSYPRYKHRPPNYGEGYMCYDMESAIYYKESKPQKPPWYYPQVQGAITSACRVKLARALSANQHAILSCHTDGFFTSQKWEGCKYDPQWKLDTSYKDASWTSLFPACYSIRTKNHHISQGPLFGEHEPGTKKTITKKHFLGEEQVVLDIPSQPLFTTRAWAKDGTTTAHKQKET